jgi:hypothetical protein
MQVTSLVNPCERSAYDVLASLRYQPDSCAANGVARGALLSDVSRYLRVIGPPGGTLGKVPTPGGILDRHPKISAKAGLFIPPAH